MDDIMTLKVNGILTKAPIEEKLWFYIKSQK